MLRPIHTVGPELVEGLPSLSTDEKKKQGFDKLSPNGFVGVCNGGAHG